MKKSFSLSSLRIFVGIFLLIIGCLIATNIWLERQRTLAREYDRLTTQAQVVRENMLQNLDAVNLVLTRLSKDSPLNENRPQYNRDLKILCDAMPGIRTLLVLDADGLTRYSNREELNGRNFAQRDYFKAPFKQRDNSMLYISPPFLTVLGTYTINLTRIIAGPNGEFAGVVSAALEPAYFSPLLDSVRYTPDMFSAIAHGNGGFLLMVPENKEVVKRNLAQPDTFFSQHLTSGKPTTAHVGQTSLLPFRQTTVWTTVQPSKLNMDFPLLAAVSRDYDVVFAPWRREALIQSGLFGLLTLICVAGLLIYQRRQVEFAAQEEKTHRLIAEQNERFVMASNAANLGFWDLDVQTGTLKWDDWMFRIYGRSKLDGDQPYDLWAKNIHPDDLARSEQELNDAINGIREFNTEFRVIYPDGSVRNIMAIASATRDAGGHALKMFGVNYDVTETRNAVQRQAQLVNKLTRINDELNNFAYVASHDLKSPLRGIDQLATWIAEDLGDDLNSETQVHLRLMRSRISRMEMLLDDLLAYSRVGRVNDEIVLVNTHELVEDVFALTTSNDTQFRLNLPDNMPALQTKKVPLELVFRNLISNAIKHHDKTQGTINISAHPLTNGFAFEVKDDGPGIPLEHQQRVFAMFQTLKPRDEIEGSGIGLALVKKTVESVGGTISLESDGQHGCVFRFTWPTIIPKEDIA